MNPVDLTLGEVSLERMVRAVENVRQRLLRAARALGEAGIPYAVVGGNAVAAWVARVDEAAVRNTQDVDILLRREDLESAQEAMSSEGFVYRHVKGVDLFLDSPQARARDAVRVVFAGEKVRPEYDLAAPNVADAKSAPEFRLLNLEPLVAMKLTSFRLQDQVQLQALAAVGLIDETWLQQFPPALNQRLLQILNNPEG